MEGTLHDETGHGGFGGKAVKVVKKSVLPKKESGFYMVRRQIKPAKNYSKT